MHKSKNSIKSNYLFFIILCSCIFCTLIIVKSIYKTNSYSNIIINSKDADLLSLLTPSIEEFNTINNSIEKCINNSSIDTINSVDILNKSVDNLDNLTNKIFSISINNNPYPTVLSDFALCINSTQNLYKYCIDSLDYNNNLSASQIETEINSLISTCNTNYSVLTNYNIYLSLPKCSLEFCDNLISYLTSMENLTLNNNLKNEKAEKFINTFNSTLNDFSKLLQDLEPAVLKIREDGRSLNVLLDDLTIKEDRFNDIKKNFIYSSIPEGYYNYYNSLINIFDSYEDYLSSIRYAISYENCCSSYTKSKKDIDNNYNDAFSKYNNITTNITTLKPL